MPPFPAERGNRRLHKAAGQIALIGVVSLTGAGAGAGSFVTGGTAVGPAGCASGSSTEGGGGGGGLAVSYSSPGCGRGSTLTLGGAFFGGAVIPE